MRSLPTVPRRIAAAVVLMLFGPAATADAGPVTIANETHRIVVIQTTLRVGDQSKRCKPLRLLPGERHTGHYANGALAVEVFDGGTEHRVLYSGELQIRSGKQAYAVVDRGGRVSVVPARGNR